MGSYPSLIAGIVLAVMLHADWHLARSHHHGLLNPGLNWPHHWAATAAVFGVVGFIIARFWPHRRWRLGATALVIGIALAQLIEPVGEAAVFQRRLGYVSEAARWVAFWQALAAALPTYLLALWLGALRTVFRIGNAEDI
jgi:hypothetical protein